MLIQPVRLSPQNKKAVRQRQWRNMAMKRTDGPLEAPKCWQALIKIGWMRTHPNTVVQAQWCRQESWGIRRARAVGPWLEKHPPATSRCHSKGWNSAWASHSRHQKLRAEYMRFLHWLLITSVWQWTMIKSGCYGNTEPVFLAKIPPIHYSRVGARFKSFAMFLGHSMTHHYLKQNKPQMLAIPEKPSPPPKKNKK